MERTSTLLGANKLAIALRFMTNFSSLEIYGPNYKQDRFIPCQKVSNFYSILMPSFIKSLQCI